MESVRLKVLIYRVLAAFGVVGGLIVLVLSARGSSSFPDRQSLIELKGKVAWVHSGRYGLRFGLEGDRRTFVYSKKSGNASAVAAALNNLQKQPITIWIDGSSDTGASPHQVLEIRTRKEALRSLSEVRRSWIEDYRYGYFAGALVLLAAWFLGFQARKIQQQL